ncbi:twin-arginine translocation signal domain-containing protein [bacterium]|nr:twin-arginine translocation signal domain-containing protein [bacterium]
MCGWRWTRRRFLRALTVGGCARRCRPMLRSFA